MEKRYQVFISSTFADLQEERREVIQALLELDCMPAGMELFPAADEDQLTLIKRVIDECDYYVLIVGGRYGSLSASGVSYTQLEYEYAVSQNKPVMAFLHKDPDSIAAGKTERTEAGKKKLAAFRAAIEKKKHCRYWTSPPELAAVVSRSLVKQIKQRPAVGWVRADALLDESAGHDILFSKIGKIATELSRIKESLSTYYIGRITDYLPQVVREVRSAKRSITILCDFPAYGYFSTNNAYKEYRIAIRKKIDNPNINVSLMCLDEGRRAEANLKALSITRDFWEGWKQDAGHNALLRKLGYGAEDIERLGLDEFLKALEAVDQEMLNIYCKGASIEEVNTDLTFDFWLFDDKRLVFVFSTYSGLERQYGFFTEDKELISAFTEIRDRYRRTKAEGDGIGRGNQKQRSST